MLSREEPLRLIPNDLPWDLGETGCEAKVPGGGQRYDSALAGKGLVRRGGRWPHSFLGHRLPGLWLQHEPQSSDLTIRRSGIPRAGVPLPLQCPA